MPANNISPEEHSAEDRSNRTQYSPEYYTLCGEIRQELLTHLESIGFQTEGEKLSDAGDDKSLIRSFHAYQREELFQRESKLVGKYGRMLLTRYFANGSDIDPAKTSPYISEVEGNTEDGNLFRFASLLWSVPVSHGYGRRMRFLVRDQANGKLIGIFALADPVFNLNARDQWIGWNSSLRKQYLVNVMDAFVAGAVPPYNFLLGGKLVASLMTSQEVVNAFNRKYNQSTGIISHQQKHARLALITVTSALGRSSLYNRLKLKDYFEFIHIGQTRGYGHFQVPQPLFLKIRHLLEMIEHKYASGHQYGDGPNWRIRVIREGISRAGLNPDILLRHGIAREIYACPLLENWRDILLGNVHETREEYRPSAADIARAVINRWLLPRAERMQDYRTWTIEDTWERILPGQDVVPTQIGLPLPSHPLENLPE